MTSVGYGLLLNMSLGQPPTKIIHTKLNEN